MNAEKGGTFRMSFENFSTGNSHSFGGTYLEIKSNEFLKYTDKFDDPNLPGEMITTVSLRKSIGGTEIKIQQEGIPEVIPAEMCYLGWQESLEMLAKLVEPEIPDAGEASLARQLLAGLGHHAIMERNTQPLSRATSEQTNPIIPRIVDQTQSW